MYFQRSQTQNHGRLGGQPYDLIWPAHQFRLKKLELTRNLLFFGKWHWEFNNNLHPKPWWVHLHQTVGAIYASDSAIRSARASPSKRCSKDKAMETARNWIATRRDCRLWCLQSIHSKRLGTGVQLPLATSRRLLFGRWCEKKTWRFFSIHGFPVVTIGFNTKVVQWLGWFGVPPFGKTSICSHLKGWIHAPLRFLFSFLISSAILFYPSPLFVSSVAGSEPQRIAAAAMPRSSGDWK